MTVPRNPVRFALQQWRATFGPIGTGYWYDYPSGAAGGPRYGANGTPERLTFATEAEAWAWVGTTTEPRPWGFRVIQA